MLLNFLFRDTKSFTVALLILWGITISGIYPDLKRATSTVEDQEMERLDEIVKNYLKTKKILEDTLSKIVVATISNQSYLYNKSLITNELIRILSMTNEQLTLDSNSSKIGHNLFNTAIYYVVDSNSFIDTSNIKIFEMNKKMKKESIRLDTFYFSKDKNKVAIVCTFTTPEIKSIFNKNTGKEITKAQNSSGILILVGQKLGEYYFISHEDHGQWSGYIVEYPNQDCAFVYGLLASHRTEVDPTGRNLWFQNSFWNDTIGRFNFVKEGDSLKHTFQFSAKKPAPEYYYPTLKIKLKAD